MRGSCSVATAGVLGGERHCGASSLVHTAIANRIGPADSGGAAYWQTKHRSALAKRALAPGGAPVGVR